MEKKLKMLSVEEDRQLANAVRKSARQIWQAGLDAFARAQEEGGEGAARALEKCGVSPQQEIAALTRRVEALDLEVARLSLQQNAAAKGAKSTRAAAGQAGGDSPAPPALVR